MPVPPEAARVWLYGTVTSPLGSGEVVVIDGAAMMVIDSGVVTQLPALSATLKVPVVGPPAVVGVPLITPSEPSDSPPGKAPDCIDQV